MLLAKLLKQMKEKNIDLVDFELQCISPTVEIEGETEKVVEFELKFLRRERQDE